MPRHLLLFILVSFLSFAPVFSQVPGTAKITLSPSMVVNESGHGDATLLVDEQDIAGDPLNGAGGHPETLWTPGWGDLQYNASAYIDLGGEYALSHIFLYDFTGIKDFTVEVGGPGNWTYLFTDDLASYKTWKKHEVNLTTRYVRVTRHEGGSNVNEIVLYGAPVNNAPVLGPIANQFVAGGGQLTVGLSASDIDGDSLAFSVDSPIGFISLTDQSSHTAKLDIAPLRPSKGEYEVSVMVNDGKGGKDSTTFVLTVNGDPTGEVAKISLVPSMVVNEAGHGDATLLVDEQGMSGDPLGGGQWQPFDLLVPRLAVQPIPCQRLYRPWPGVCAFPHIPLRLYREQ